MTHSDADRWTLGNLPFIWKPLDTPHNPAGLADALPFSLEVHEDTGVLAQGRNPVVASALERAYSLGSAITGQMDERGIGRGYADDFLDFVAGRVGLSRFDGRRVLEIGCGNGYLLHRLARHGAVPLGIDPGQHGRAEFEVPIIHDFFPSSRVNGKFDVIVAFAMLEHVEAPRQFLEELFALLEPEGEVLIGVPDCGPYIDAGDISCLFHEHWSYFDQDSLDRTARWVGAVDVEITHSNFGGMLYARITPGDSRSEAATATRIAGLNKLHAFRDRAERRLAAVAEYFRAAAARRETVGIYVPSRIVNALSVGRISTSECRFFDDNRLMKGTYFPGFAIPIEERRSLVDNPTDRVLIMSRTFGETIARELRHVLPRRIKITTWPELFEAERPSGLDSAVS